MSIEIKRLTLGIAATNCYIVGDTDTGEALVVDPVDDAPLLFKTAQDMGWTIKLILATHGHFDHLSDTIALARKFAPPVVAIFETCLWLGSKGVENLVGMNKGGSMTLGPLTVTMTHAVHSCGIQDGDQVIYGGEAAGYVVEFENGFRIYHSGDTCVFGDMRIIAELYQPHVIFLPIGDLFTMSPKEAAYACRLMNAKKVVPMHYGTFPPLVGTPEQLRELTKDLGTQVLALKPGETGGQ